MDDVTRLVVVAPHPDDEVLQAGGLMHCWARLGRPVVVVAVTDGEASHAASTRITPGGLRWRRHVERCRALGRLGVSSARVVRLGFPDQGCGRVGDLIARSLAEVLRAGDLIVTSCRFDRHPDHVATAEATAAAATEVTAAVWEAPTWALVHGCAPDPTVTLRLDDEAWATKCHAIESYRSQLVALGPSTDDGPVVHPHELAVLSRRDESFIAVAT